MERLLVILATITMTVSGMRTPSWPNPYWDIPGQFCSSQYPRLQCCPGRQDRCSTPILGTTCYCDQFCNRTENADCCPDYFSHCEGLEKDKYQYQEGAPPEEITRPECTYGLLNISNPVCIYKGQEYGQKDQIKDNCNNCKCEISSTVPGCMSVLCSSEQCLINDKVIIELKAGEESGTYTWRPSNYSQFWGRRLEEGARLLLGAVRPDISILRMSAIQFSYSPSSLLKEFDSRTKWPGLVGPVQDQGWCGSSWAMVPASLAGDRLGISKGVSQVISPQTIISCVRKDSPDQCTAGHVDQALNFLRRHGAWPLSCHPYTFGSGETGVSCPTPGSITCPLIQTQPAYRVGRDDTINQPRRREQDIMYEIQTQGPVLALMEVWTDMFMYRSGVYSVTNLAGDTVVGYQAVRIVGWGEEVGVPYWLVVNSWGDNWGEEGVIRVKRGQNVGGLEEFVVGVWPKLGKRPARSRGGPSRRRSGRLRRIRHGRRPSRERSEERGGRRRGDRRRRLGKHSYFQVG